MSNSPYLPYIQPLLAELGTRSRRAALSLMGISNTSLRTHLTGQLSGDPGSPSSLLADPVFEPTFGWTESGITMSELSGGLLHPDLVRCMANPPRSLAEDYTFPSGRSPFSHQLDAWKLLCDDQPRSLVVTSGTGSGKTECFLVPILNKLARQAEQESMQGVRALFIYPLNALIASQQNRLDAWTDGFGGKLRYCLYTGNLPNEAKNSQREYQGQVIDRRTLRSDPPPILVTNATMLEYMLVRKEDNPILEKSQGKLEWIVLDEAHTHIGSQAAEMALLLRRVMLAFGVAPQNVRFVATSATFGENEQTTRKLKEFLANMAGVSPDQVCVVHGKRHVPLLPQIPAGEATQTPVETITELDRGSEVSAERFRALAMHPVAREIRAKFTPAGQTLVQKLSSLVDTFRTEGMSRKEMLDWLDLLSGTRPHEREQSFLPLRTHIFQNVLSGVYACVNPSCEVRTDALRSPEWPFGGVYMAERTTCDCGAPVLPVVTCRECSTVHLLGEKTSEHKLVAPRREDREEFALEADEVPEEGEAAGDNLHQLASHSTVLVSNRTFDGRCPTAWLDVSRHTLRSHAGTAEDPAISLNLVEQDGSEYCPACDDHAGALPMLRRIGLSSSFTMGVAIGTLLEYCPDDKDAPLSKPFRGRKMISFTDSRQGTARTAVKLQQDSERSRVRGLIYHLLLQSRQSGQGLTDPEQMLFDMLAPMEAQLTGDQLKVFKDLKTKRDSGPIAELGWSELRAKLAGSGDIEAGMLDYYHGIAPNVFSKGGGASLLALMLMYREFARRPKNQNSLESMGLVAIHYPQLDGVKQIPVGWPSDLASWQRYLKVLLDFYVRENSFVELDKELRRFVGIRINPKWLLAPTSAEKGDSRHVRWTQVNPKSKLQARPVRLLAHSAGWDVETKRDVIDNILRAAWLELTERTAILVKSEDGFRLDYSKVRLRLVSRAGVCPVTRRFIDTSFAGVTPYLPAKLKDTPSKVEMTDIPTYPHAFGKGDEYESKLRDAREWLRDDAQVVWLRDQGLWSDLHDRTIEGGAWFHCAEHSAQQPRSRLKRYEEQFKTGRINLMSCSTTMEMGVDIGGITIVAMNNVPPHPANYLQRAGRAGRRREGRAVALTVCKNTPHDQSVFVQPDWPFTTEIRVPDVSLRSPELVQRHINSWLLAYWFRRIAGNEELKGVNCATFFIKQGDYSVADRFMLWCNNGDKNLNAPLLAGLEGLTRNTPMSAVPPSRLAMMTGEAMKEVRDQWNAVYDGVVQQRKVFAGDSEQRNSALKALELQIRRVEEEYLLSELANRRFLPGYGFPTDVVSLDNRTYSTLQANDQSREDNRGRYQDLPSRDRVTALREYAPGAELVIDGLVYRSRGITLNWHVPASEADVKEAQLFKHAWRCRRCGASGNSLSVPPDCCLHCGATLRPKDVLLYLVPSGFAVDFFEEPHTDVSAQQYIPVKLPWLSVNAPWIALANPGAGRFRSSNRAHLFNHSSGMSGNGYAVCLECGRAEPMLASADAAATDNEAYLPHIFRAKEWHRRLRGNKGADNSRKCPGSDNPWKIKQHVHLGHDSVGDALEVMLSNAGGIGWLNDEVAAYSIAVAMRTVIAKTLGILEDELGCTTSPILEDGQEIRTLQVFDQRSGGYTALAAPLLQTSSFWREVRNGLECPAECPGACQHCLLGFDTRFAADKLNRFRGLEVLNEAWVSHLSLPDHLAVFGGSTVPESVPLFESMEREIEATDAIGLRLYFHGETSLWDLPSAHGLQRLLHKVAALSLPVELCAAHGSLASLDEANRHKLAEWVGGGATYRELPPTSMVLGKSSVILLAGVKHKDNWIGWASDMSAAGSPCPGWGQLDASTVLLRGRLTLDEMGKNFSVAEIRPAYAGDKDLQINDEIDGSIDGFGSRFWAHVASLVPILSDQLNREGDPLISVEYGDRYLRSPLTAGLLISLIYALKHLPAGQDGFSVRVNSLAFVNQRETVGRIWDDWPGNQDRDSILQQALEDCGLDAEVRSFAQGELEHSRILLLEFSSGKAVWLRLDQGVSYWNVPRQPRFPRFGFDRPHEEQALELINMAGNVTAPEKLPSHIFVKTGGS